MEQMLANAGLTDAPTENGDETTPDTAEDETIDS